MASTLNYPFSVSLPSKSRRLVMGDRPRAIRVDPPFDKPVFVNALNEPPHLVVHRFLLTGRPGAEPPPAPSRFQPNVGITETHVLPLQHRAAIVVAHFKMPD